MDRVLTAEKAAGRAKGHFGLLGMSERAKRLGGQFTCQAAGRRDAGAR